MLGMTAFNASAGSNGAAPVVNTTIAVSQTGSEPFDGNTWSPDTNANPGEDSETDNNIVRLQDSITYKVEISVNDAEVDNLISVVELDTLQSWISIPSACLEDPALVDPVSTISEDGRTLTCNLGPAIEGTERVFYPVARAIAASFDGEDIALNGTEINANVSGYAVGDTGTSNLAEDGPTEAFITAFFRVNTTKELKSTATDPETGEPTYSAAAKTGNPATGNGSVDGSVIEYSIIVNYVKGSMIADSDEAAGNYEIDFTLLDHYTDDNPNNNVASSVVPTQTVSTGAVLYDWDPGKPACELIGDHGDNATVTCTQVDYLIDELNGAGVGPDTVNDPNIEIVLENIDVRDPDKDTNLLELRLNIWHSEPADIATSDNCGPPCQITTINSVGVYSPTLGSVVGFDPYSIEDENGLNLSNYDKDNDGTGEPHPEIVDYNLIYSTPGSWNIRKSFYGISTTTSETGKPTLTRSYGRGETIPLLMNIFDYRNVDGGITQFCDKIDTNNFEYIGLSEPNRTDTGYSLNNARADNPTVVVFGGGPGNQYLDASSTMDILFSAEPHPTLLEQRDDTCDDDINGDGFYVIDSMIQPTGTVTTTLASDWVSDPTLFPTQFPNGNADVTKIRLETTFDSDLIAENDPVSTQLIWTTNLLLKIKDDAVGYTNSTTDITYIPNYSTARRRLPDQEWGVGADWLDTSSGTYDVSVDPQDVGFSYEIILADRVILVDSSMSIQKYTEPRGLKVVKSGEIVEFIVEPQVNGAWSPTFTTAEVFDDVPNGTDYIIGTERFSTDGGSTWLTYDEYVASNPDVTITSPANDNANRDLFWDFGDLQTGEQMPLIKYAVQVDPGRTSGTFRNTVTLNSDIGVDELGGGDPDGDGPLTESPDGTSDEKEARYEITILPANGVQVQKTVDELVYEVNAPFTFDLTYINMGGEDYSNAQFIDILPYNEDGTGANTSGLASTRYPNSTFSGTYELTGIAASNSETFEVSTDDPTTIQQDPCHEDNYPNGTTPAIGDACYDYYSNAQAAPAKAANTFAGGSATGTGNTTWIACSTTGPSSCGVDLEDITAVRFSVPSLPGSQGGHTVSLTLTPTGNVGGTPVIDPDNTINQNSSGDIYTNNFGGRVSEASLVIISNDVAVTMVAGSIGDRVWLDDNGNGIQEASEQGIGGVTLQLLDAGGNPIYVDPVTGGIVPMGWPDAVPYETTTDPFGNYSFENLPSDTYQVVVDPTTLPSGLAQTYDASGALDNASTHVLQPELNSAGQLANVEDNTTQDFGYRPLETAAIGNYVWLDENNDGEQDAGERGIPNVIVTLTPADHIDLGNGPGAAITTTTDANGYYLFDNLPPEDGYDVSVTVLQDAINGQGLQYTVENNDGSNANDADFGNQRVGRYTLDLSEGEVDLSADFGFNYNSDAQVDGGTGPAAIGDTIWIDDDGDGIVDDGELGVSGVVVTLFGDPDGDGIYDTVVMTTTTDANGHYIFDGLTPDAYSVGVTNSSNASHDILNNLGNSQYQQTGDPEHHGTTGTNNDSYGEPVVLAPGDVYLNMDFGYQPQAGNEALNSVGDTIFYDVDADGIDEAEDEGIAGVTVSLIDDLDGDGVWDPGEPIIATDTTDENGNYLFENLPDGDYIVWVNDTDGVLSGLDPTYDPEGLLDNLSSVDLDSDGLNNASVDNLDQDFGYSNGAPEGVIGDTIWFDIDGSGGDQSTQGFDPGIGAVTVNLFLDEDGNGEPDDQNGDNIIDENDAVDTTSTNANGEYLFTGLPYGDYVVGVVTSTLPAEFNPTATHESDGDTDGYGATVTLDAANPEDLDQDFSYTMADTDLGSIGDTIFGDLDGTEADGTPDAGDVPLVGVTVLLEDSNGNTWTTVTDENGNYLFDQLPTDTYTVTVVTSSLPEGFSTTSTYEDDGGSDSVSSLTLNPGEHNRDQDFSYPPTGESYTIGDTIWFDVDSSGGDQATQGDEPGLSDVEVSIYDSTGALVATTTTGENGYYLFTGLLTDTYTITVNTDTLPPYVTVASSYDGSDGGTDSTSTVTVDAANPHSRAEDFSYPPNVPGAIGDTIWFDLDGDMSQGPNEGGIPGVVVELTLPNGTVISTTTDAQGNYYFDNLPTSATGETFTVTVDTTTLPAGMSQTFDNDGTGTANQSVVQLLSSDPIDLDQDFGYNGENSLGNLIFLDTNADGTYDADGADNLPGTDDDEGLIAGVTVELWMDIDGDGELGPNDALVATTVTTGTNGTVGMDEGNYLFDNLPDGDFFVRVSDDDNVLNGYWHSDGEDGLTNESQDNSVYAVSLDPDNNSGAVQDLTADFGYYLEPASLGNYVWVDTNGDGLQNDGETGLNGVEVQLTIVYSNGTSITVTAVTTDDIDGNPGFYSFDNLLLDEDYVQGSASGTASATEPAFTISVDPNQAVLGNYAPTTSNVNNNADDGADSDPASGVIAIPLQGLTDVEAEDPSTDEQTIASYDFGFAPATAALGNYIWLDEDGDGEQDAGERGLANVVVTLTPASDVDLGNGLGQPITTTTDANGGYLFDMLPAGAYTVTVDSNQSALTDLTYTQAALAGADFGNQDPTGYVVDLDAGEVDLTADFGFNYGDSDGNTGLAALGDRIWADVDGDGFQDPGELGIAGITVTATASDGTVYTTTTDALGNYIFPSLPADAYTVDVVNPPAGWTATGDPDHYGTTGTSNDTTDTPIILAPGDFVQTVDFGYQPPADTYDNSIGDTIWLDSNADGNQDASADEPGLAGVTVSLLDSNGDVIAMTTTDEDGNYLFDNLPDGTYSVEVTDTDGVLTELIQTGDPDSTLDDVSTTSVSGGQDDLDQDFGYTPLTASDGEGLIGDTIWLDSNGDGDQDPGEEGLEGVIVTLTDSNGNVLTTTTDAQGNYYFPGLDVDADGETYTVTVVTATLPDDVSSTVDPDATGDPFVSVVVIDDSDPINLEQDFGVVGQNSLSGTIWEDVNVDGTLTVTETSRFEGVTVLLLDDDGNVIATTETDSNGDYSFDGLPDGEFTVVVEDADGVLNGYWHSDGPNDGANNNSQSDPYTVDLDSGNLDDDPVSDDTADFGYYIEPASVGNYVWIDADGDGLQDAEDIGIDGVTVTLEIEYPDGTTIELTTVTGDNPDTPAVEQGWYSFDGLLLDEDYNTAGSGSGGTAPSYTISVDTGQGSLVSFDPTQVDAAGTNDSNDSDDHSGVSAVPVMGSSDTDTNSDPTAEDAIATYDFGFVGIIEVGDTVWFDQDEDGVLDSSEIGIPGITVTLTVDVDGDGTVDITRTMQTDMNGEYLFENVPPGNVTIVTGPPAGYDPTYDYDDGITLPDNMSAITLTIGITEELDQDFGYSGDASIGDFVWFDIDNDGVDDPDEPGIPGVVITLTTPWGGVITTTTDANGEYLFDNLPPGDYTVTAEQPAGTVNTYDEDSGNIGADNTSDTNLEDEENEREQDFGYVGTGSIGDTVWFDFDNDGAQDADEPGIEGITVTLDIDFDGDGTTDFVMTTTTDENGEYLFDNLPAGSYTITVTPPAGYTQTFDDENPLDHMSEHILGVGEDNVDQDFGYTGNGEIGDTIWWDIDGDGVYSPTTEAGIPGVVVTLTVDFDLDGTVDFTTTTTTDENGEYLFENLPPGDYDITVEQPGGTTQTADPNGGNDNMSEATLTLTDTVDLDQDHGYNGIGSIGDTVWYDANNDGDQDSGEPGIAGITVTLGVDLDGDGTIDHTLITTTDDDGMYLFENLPEGDYTITVTPPAGFDQTYDASDSLDDTSEYALGAGEDNVDQDFGYTGDGSIGDTVWFDLDADGMEDAGEPGVPGITVTVSVDWDGDGSADYITSTVTASDGSYLVENLPPGDYTVSIDAPEYIDTYDADDGTTDPDGSSELTLGDGEDNLEQDFGIAGTGSIGDTIYYDLDGDGMEDQLEGGIPGVVVTLTLPWGDVLTDTTDSNGEYLFENLPPGDYTVEVDTSTIPDNHIHTGDPQGAIDHTSEVTLGDGEENLDQDFGYQPLVAEITLDKTVYLGHDSGASCAGNEFVTGDFNDDVTYCFVVTNTGITWLDDIEIVDADLGITLTISGPIAPMAVVTEHLEANIDGFLLNTASVSANPTDELGTDLVGLTDPTDSDTAVVNENVITPQPAIDLEKTVYEGHDGGASCPGTDELTNFDGTEVTFCFTVKNDGNVDLVDVVITDTHYSLTFTVPYTLEPGASATFHYETVISGTLINRADAVGQPYDERGELITSVDPPTDHDNATVLSQPATPAIQIDKTVYSGHDNGALCEGGENVTDLFGSDVTFCFVVTNTGNTYLSDVVVTDPTLGVTLTVPGILSPTASVTLSSDSTINISEVNTAAATGNPVNEAGDDITGAVDPSDDDTASVSLVDPMPAIELEKTVYAGHDGGQSCAGSNSLVGNVGDEITYCFVVENTGNTWLDEVEVVDSDLGVTLTVNHLLAPMEVVTLTAEATLDGALVNSAETNGNPTNSSGDDLPGVDNPTDSDTATVSDEPLTAAVEIEKTVYQGHDSGVSCAGENLVEAIANTEVTYCFAVTNAGTTDLVDVVVVDSALGITLTVNGTLAAGTGITLHAETTIDGNLLNTATVTGHPVDDSGNDIPGLEDPTDSDTASVTELDPLPAIDIEKTVYSGSDNGASCEGDELIIEDIGATVTYCFEVTNTGNTPLANVQVEDPLLSLSLTYTGTLQPNESIMLHAEAIVDGILVNTAEATGEPVYDDGTPIPDVADPTDEDTATVSDVYPLPAIDLEKTVYAGHDNGASCEGAEIASGPEGADVTWCFKVTNDGSTWLSDISVYDATLDITVTSSIVLTPQESIMLYYEGTISESMVNSAEVTANPVDENGTDIPSLPEVSDDNDARVIMEAPTYSIGNFVWLEDGGPDSQYNGTDTGIDGVRIELWDGPPNQSGSNLVMVDTTEDGAYHFDGVGAGTYYVHIPAGNFIEGGPLHDAGSGVPFDLSTLYSGALTDDVMSGTGEPATGVTSGPIAIGDGNQPTGEDPHDIATGYSDSETEWNVDFGFFIPASTAVTLAAVSTTTASGTWMVLAALAATTLTVWVVFRRRGKLD